MKESADELIDAIIAVGRALFRSGRIDWLDAASDLAHLGADLRETHQRNKPHVDRLLQAALDAPDAPETDLLFSGAPPVIKALAFDRFDGVLRTFRQSRAGGFGLAGQKPRRGVAECIRIVLMEATPGGLPPLHPPRKAKAPCQPGKPSHQKPAPKPKK